MTDERNELQVEPGSSYARSIGETSCACSATAAARSASGLPRCVRLERDARSERGSAVRRPVHRVLRRCLGGPLDGPRSHDQDRLCHADHGPVLGLRRSRRLRDQRDQAGDRRRGPQQHGTTYPIDIHVKDSQGDPNTAAAVAGSLILDDKVDLMLVASTPETTNPVADQCEANGVPCISTVTPWQPYFLGRQAPNTAAADSKPFQWTYHFFWGLEDIISVFQDMWSKVPNNKVVGFLMPNDGDGNAWSRRTSASRRRSLPRDTRSSIRAATRTSRPTSRARSRSSRARAWRSSPGFRCHPTSRRSGIRRHRRASSPRSPRSGRRSSSRPRSMRSVRPQASASAQRCGGARATHSSHP